MIVSRTPLRITLGGGGTDLPFYSNRYGGSLITAAINRYVYITVSPMLQNKYKLNYSKTEIVDNIDSINHNLIRECLRYMNVRNPVEIHSVAEVPSGSGLGSSAAFTVGMLNALHYQMGNLVSKYSLAEDASSIIMDILKEPCGKQDQYASAFGSIIQMSTNTNGKVTVTPINISRNTVAKLENNLLMFYTGFTRPANQILQEQKNKAEQKSQDDIFEYYHKIKEIGMDSLTCLESGNLKRFGGLMDTHWNLKRGILDDMSNTDIDNWYSLALENGALGGKIVGAGSGGFLMLYVEDFHEQIKKVLGEQGLLFTPFKFDFNGSVIVYDGKHF